MEDENDFKEEKSKSITNKVKRGDDMPKVKGHLRRVFSSSGRCLRRVRVESHRRRLPTKRWRIFR